MRRMLLTDAFCFLRQLWILVQDAHQSFFVQVLQIFQRELLRRDTGGPSGACHDVPRRTLLLLLHVFVAMVRTPRCHGLWRDHVHASVLGSKFVIQTVSVRAAAFRGAAPVVAVVIKDRRVVTRCFTTSFIHQTCHGEEDTHRTDSTSAVNVTAVRCGSDTCLPRGAEVDLEVRNRRIRTL